MFHPTITTITDFLTPIFCFQQVTSGCSADKFVSLWGAAMSWWSQLSSVLIIKTYYPKYMKSHCIHLTAIPNSKFQYWFTKYWTLKFSEFTVAEKNSFTRPNAWKLCRYTSPTHHLHITLDNSMETQLVKNAYINVISLNIKKKHGIHTCFAIRSPVAMHYTTRAIRVALRGWLQ